MDNQLLVENRRLRPSQSVFTLALDVIGGTSIATHQHAEGQLLFASAGVLAVATNQGCWIVPSNNGLWIPANVPHSTRTIGTSSIRTLYLAENRTASLPGECALLAVSGLLKALIVAALEIKGNSLEASRDTRLIDLLMDELVAAPVSSVYLPSPKGERLKALCRGIFLNGTLDWGLAECAAFLNVNVKTVQRWFSSDLGISFGAWRKQARLLLALERLALGHNILEVSIEAGYSSPSAFSAMFRREFGMPPRLFQRP